MLAPACTVTEAVDAGGSGAKGIVPPQSQRNGVVVLPSAIAVETSSEPTFTAAPLPISTPAGEKIHTPPLALRLPLMVVNDAELTMLSAMEVLEGCAYVTV